MRPPTPYRIPEPRPGSGNREVSERRIDQVRIQLSGGDVAAAPAGEDDQRS